MTFPCASQISEINNPLDWDEAKNSLMVKACREMAIFHQENSKDIAHLYSKNGFDPNSLQVESDFTRLPYVGVTAMKTYLLLSLPEKEACLKLTSSGTRGQKTQIWFDKESLNRVQKMLDVQWQQEGLVSQTPTNYLCFIYDPIEAGSLGIAFSVENEQRFAPRKDSYFCVRKNAEGNWELRIDEVIQRLHHYARERSPVRLLGIPSFMFELLSVLSAKGKKISLPPQSYVLTGGGWKAAEDKSITREQFRNLLTKTLGIPDENIRDGFGMAEHSAPYMECKHHKFHIPVYNRIIVRDPITDEAVPNGEVGVLELITPFNAMMPNLAILTTDLGFLHKEDCSCGWKSPTFALVGRAGKTKHKGCAITAGEMVRR